MWYAVIRKSAGTIKGMTESISLVENAGIPNTVGRPGNTRGAAVETSPPCPSHRITGVNRHRRRRENEVAVRRNSYIECRRACQVRVREKRGNHCQQRYTRKRKVFHRILRLLIITELSR
jgi:hypothetical protein